MLLANAGASFNFHLNNYRVQLMQHDAQRRLDLAAGTYPGYRTCDAGARQTQLPFSLRSRMTAYSSCLLQRGTLTNLNPSPVGRSGSLLKKSREVSKVASMSHSA